MDVEKIKQLRAQTGVGMMQAKQALVETNGDLEQAVDVLRKAGAASASQRAERAAQNGIIESYVHSGRIGVLLELNCETDFVARTADFQNLARELAMQVAAANPEFVSPEAIPAERLQRERAIYAAEAEGKPAKIAGKIIDGKLEKYYETVCLVRQPYIKDPDKSVTDLINEVIAKTGENIVIGRFSRLELGQDG
jgi:elongation factor Ts